MNKTRLVLKTIPWLQLYLLSDLLFFIFEFCLMAETDVQGGKLENAMAEYMDTLLAKSPVVGKPSYNVAPTELVPFPIGDDSSEDEIDDQTRQLRGEIEAAEREAEAEGLNPEPTTAGADGDVEDMEEANEFDGEDMEEENLEGNEELAERLKELQRQIADEGLDTEGIRRLIADDKLDEKAIRLLLADDTLDKKAIRQLIAHAKLVESTMSAPDPSHPIIIVPQYRPTIQNLTDPTDEEKDLMSYVKYFETINKIHAV